jgi:hypothetical protein
MRRNRMPVPSPLFAHAGGAVLGFAHTVEKHLQVAATTALSYFICVRAGPGLPTTVEGHGDFPISGPRPRVLNSFISQSHGCRCSLRDLFGTQPLVRC